MASAAVKKRAAQARRQRTHVAHRPTPAPEKRRGLTELSSRQALWAGVAGLVLIALVSYTWYARHGGPFDDDWAGTSALISNRTDGGGWWAGVKELWDTTAWRPVLVPYGALITGPLGWHFTAQFAWVIAVSTAFVALLYQVLRTRGVGSLHAFAVAALVLVAPFGDSSTLWISGGAIRFGGLLYLAGLLVALKALAIEDGRRAQRWHVLAGVLYLLSILTYEVTAGCVFASALVYLGAAPRDRVLRRWAADVGVAVVGLIWSATHTPRPSHSLSASLHHAGQIARWYWRLYDGAVAPSWLPAHVAGVLTLVALAAAAAFVILRARDAIAGPAYDAVLLWSKVLLVAVAFVAASYVIFVPGDAYYLPNGVGTSNRMNALPVAPTVLVAYAALMVLVTGAFVLLRRRWATAALAVGLAYGLGMFITHEQTLRSDQHRWAGDYAVSRGVLDSVRHALPHPARGTYVVVLGAPASQPDGNPVFYASWDLSSALRKVYADGSIGAFNAYLGVRCTQGGVFVPGASAAGYSTRDTNADAGPDAGLTARYGTTVLIDAPLSRSYAVPDLAACRRAQQAITNG